MQSVISYVMNGSDNNNSSTTSINDLISDYPRTIEFFSNCQNKEKSYIKKIDIRNYYRCSVCCDFHMIKSVT